MSELSLNVAPPPELLKPAAGASAPAAPDRARPAAGDSAGAPNPFAALLSGVLQGAQPPAENPGLPASAGPFPDLQPPADASTSASAEVTNLLALPGTAPPLPAPVVTPTGSATPSPAGKLLPEGGNPLPLPLAGTPATADAAAAPTNQEPPAERGITPPPASRPRIFLGDLPQSRPVEPAPELPLTGASDGARAAVAALAGRSLTPGTKAPVETTARPGNPTSHPDARGAILFMEAVPAATLPVADPLPLRSAAADLFLGAGLPGTGTELLAGQLAAFAANNAGGSASGGTSSVTGAGTTDAGSAALLGRLGSTGLPPLQPQGDAGTFAGGLADRLLTLGGPGSHSARLKLHPEHLGELDVEISIEDGNAQVWFGTTTSQARDAIEGSLPRLRELFADQGIQLTRTQIDAGGGQTGNSGFGQERRMTGGAGPWNDAPAWQRGRPGAGAEPAGGIAAGTSARLLDVWA